MRWTYIWIVSKNPSKSARKKYAPIQVVPLFLVCKLKTEVKNHGSKKQITKDNQKQTVATENEKHSIKSRLLLRASTELRQMQTAKSRQMQA